MQAWGLNSAGRPCYLCLPSAKLGPGPCGAADPALAANLWSRQLVAGPPSSSKEGRSPQTLGH